MTVLSTSNLLVITLTCFLLSLSFQPWCLFVVAGSAIKRRKQRRGGGRNTSKHHHQASAEPRRPSRHPKAYDSWYQNDGSTTIIIDDYAEPMLLKRLNDTKLWESCMQLEEQWFEYGAEPKTIWEELVIEIWQYHPILATATTSGGSKIAGYAYWCNVIPARDNTEGQLWHVDKDEAAFRPHLYNDLVQHQDVKQQLNQPLLGAVYYGYPHDIKGGILEILPNQDWDSFSTEEAADHYRNQHHRDNGDKQEVLQVQPIYNRLVTTNVSKWHRVTPILDGSRYALAVNIWKHKPIAENFIKSEMIMNYHEGGQGQRQGEDEEDNDDDGYGRYSYRKEEL